MFKNSKHSYVTVICWFLFFYYYYYSSSRWREHIMIIRHSILRSLVRFLQMVKREKYAHRMEMIFLWIFFIEKSNVCLALVIRFRIFYILTSVRAHYYLRLQVGNETRYITSVVVDRSACLMYKYNISLLSITIWKTPTDRPSYTPYYTQIITFIISYKKKTFFFLLLKIISRKITVAINK